MYHSSSLNSLRCATKTHLVRHFPQHKNFPTVWITGMFWTPLLGLIATCGLARSQYICTIGASLCVLSDSGIRKCLPRPSLTERVGQNVALYMVFTPGHAPEIHSGICIEPGCTITSLTVSTIIKPLGYQLHLVLRPKHLRAAAQLQYFHKTGKSHYRQTWTL